VLLHKRTLSWNQTGALRSLLMQGAPDALHMCRYTKATVQRITCLMTCNWHVAACCCCVCLQSVSEARLLLRDWLVIFTANYHRNSFMRASAAQLLQLPVRHSARHAVSLHTYAGRVHMRTACVAADACVAKGSCGHFYCCIQHNCAPVLFHNL
jgi:hypothetical protein